MAGLPALNTSINFFGWQQQIDYISEENLAKKLAFLSEGLAVEEFLRYMNVCNVCVGNGIDPNLRFNEISIGQRIYQNPTCFHVVYLLMKSPEVEWDELTKKGFENLIDQMLADPRTDLTAVFSEYYLGKYDLAGHFFRGSQEESFSSSYLMENVTIAHYAVVLKDTTMLEKVLRRAPHLLDRPCCMVKGKLMLYEEVLQVTSLNGGEQGLVSSDCRLSNKTFNDLKELDEDEYYETHLDEESLNIFLKTLGDEVAGELALASSSFKLNRPIVPVTRITKVTLLHLAARLGDLAICEFLIAKDANRIIVDSHQRNPCAYFKLSVQEGFLNKSRGFIQKIVGRLEYKDPLWRQPPLPETHKTLNRESYFIDYNTRTKIANYVYERLTKQSYVKNATRDGVNFHVDSEIPKDNRSKNADFSHSGLHKGHLAPAANAVSSRKAMNDTFYLSNIVPQNPNLNQSLWKQLEECIQRSTESHDLVEVFTGPLFVSQQNLSGKSISIPVIGESEVAVPTHLFKVIYFHKGLNHQQEAYIVPNEAIPQNTPFTAYRRDIREVQRLSGILFSEWRAK